MREARDGDWMKDIVISVEQMRKLTNIDIGIVLAE